MNGVNEETLKAVSGGLAGYTTETDGFKPGAWETKELVCPACGKGMGMFSSGVYEIELHTTCPHCGEHITVKG